MSFTMHMRINRNLRSQLDQEIEQAMKQSALIVHGEVKRVLTGQRSGRLYRVPATRRMYTASAPNEAPATRLGALRQSYEWVINGHGVRSEIIIGTRIKYAVHLEFGTSRMSPRKHLSVAFKNKKGQVQDLFRDFL